MARGNLAVVRGGAAGGCTEAEQGSSLQRTTRTGGSRNEVALRQSISAALANTVFCRERMRVAHFCT